MVKLQINEKDRIQMRQQAKQLLPGNPDTVECQRSVLKMIEAVLPAAEICSRNADATLWPRVQRREVTMRAARRKCGGYLDKLMGITIVENLKLEEKSAVVLQRAWIALETFGQVMSPEETIKIRAFQDHILAALLQRESQATVSNKDFKPSGQTVDVKTIPVGPVNPVNPVPPVNQPPVNVPPISTPPVIPAADPVSAFETTGEGKKKKNPAAAIIAAVVVLALLAVGVTFGLQFMQVNKVVSAIDAIGTVTMESSGPIKNAEMAYEELSESLQGKVGNYETLAAARAEYDRLEKLVQDAVDAINNIGTVTLNSGSKIDQARKAYDALKADELTGYVFEESKILTAAEEKYEDLCVEDLFNTGNALREEKKYEEALAKFQELLKNFPNSSKASAAKEGAAACVVGVAQASFDAAEYEKTMTLLSDGRENYGDTKENQDLLEKLVKKLESLRPTNKKTFKDTVGWGWGKLAVTAGTKDACFRIIAVDENGQYLPETVMLFYVRAGETVEMAVKNGEYKVQYTSGDYWFGNDVGFGADAVYKEVTKDYSYDSWREGSYVYYYKFDLTLYDAESGDFIATKITSDKFWN